MQRYTIKTQAPIFVKSNFLHNNPRFNPLKLAGLKKIQFFVGLWSLFCLQNVFAQTVNLGNNQIICAGSNSVTVTAAVSNLQGLTISSYAWTINGASTGTSTSTSIIVNAGLSPNNLQVVNCVVTLSNGTVNSTIDDDMNVYTIDPGVIGSNQFSCYSPFTPNTFTSSSSGTTSIAGVNNFNSNYQWESAPTVNGPWSAINGQTNASYSPSIISSTTYYRRVIAVTIGQTNPLTVSCVSNTLVVQVLNVPSISSNQCINSGASANMSVSFSPALPSGYTSTYSWSGPNSFSSSNATASVLSFGANKAGTYYATVTVTGGGNSCSYPLSTQLNLVPNTPTFSIPVNGCPGTAYIPTGFITQSGVNYQWIVSPSSNSTGLTTSSPTFLFNSGGNYSISVNATLGTCTNFSPQQSINVLDLSNVLPDISGSNMQVINGINTFPICSGTSTSTALVYNNNFLNPPNTTYSYSLNGGISTAIDTGAYIPIIYGSNTFVLTATNGTCSLSNTVNIYSGSNPYVALGGSNSINLCPGSTVNFTVDPTQSVGVTNPPGTTYSLVFSDVTGSMNFSNLMNDTIIPHQYLTSSCGVTNTGTTFPNNTYYAVITAQNPCGTTQSFYSPITVHNMPVANYTISDSTICSGQSITVTNTGAQGSIVGTSSPYTCTAQGKFYWTITGGTIGTNFTLGTGQQLGWFNSASFNNVASNGSATLNITFLTAGYYTITQIYYNSCGSRTKVRNICVINPPTCQFTATPSSGCSPLTVAINNTTVAPTCGGTPVPLTYAWTITPPSGTTSSYTSSSAQAPPNLILTNPTSTPQNYTISLTVTPKDPYVSTQNFGNPNCTSTCTQTVTVNPKPVFTPANLTTCNNPYSVNVNLQSGTNVANSSFAWSAASNLNVGGETTSMQTSSSITDNLDNTSTTFQSVTYTVTPTSNLGCVGNAATFTVTLNYVDPGSISSDQTVCSGGNPANIIGTLPSGSGAITYQWQLSSNNSTWTDILGANGQSYDPPGPINANCYFRRVVTFSSNGVSCNGISNVITITVNAVLPGTISADQNLCTGDDPSALNVVLSASGTGIISVIWQQSNTPTGPWTSISGQTGSSYDPPVLSTTTYYSISATSVLNNISCSSNTPVIAVIVYSLTPGSISGTQSICEGGNPTTFTSVPASTNASTVSYQWQSSLDNINWSNISGAISATYDPPVLTTSTYYRRQVNVLIGSTVICQGLSGTISVTVIPDPNVSAPSGQTICIGGSPTPISVVPSGGISTSYSYQWFNGSTSITGANLSSYTPASSAGTYYCQVSINLSAVTGCTVNSSSAQITVVPDPTVSAPVGASYCQDAASVNALSITASGGINTLYSYQWYSNTANNNTTGTLISGATSSTFTPPVNIVGTKYYYCVVTISPISTGCSVASSVAAIAVTAGPSITTQPLNQTRCIGGSFNTLTVASSGGSGTPTYQWYSNTTNSNNGGTLINGATAAIYSLPSNLSSMAGINYYYCVISFSSSGGCSVISSNVAAITVLAPPTVNSINNQFFCKNSVVSSTPITANYSSGMSYVWSVSGANIGLSPASGTSNTIPGFNTINNGTSPLTATVSITPSYTITNVNGGTSLTCSGSTTSAFTITVNPTPVMQQFNPLLYVFCENTTGFVPFTANISSGMSYSWTNDNIQIGVGATGTSTSPGLSFTAVNNLSNPNQPLTSNFMVTPIYTNNGVSCPGTAVPFAITINPLPDVIPLPDYTICATNTGSNQFSSLNPIVGLGTSYVWTNSNLAIGMAASGTGSHFFTATNTSTVPITGTVTVTPTYSNNGVSCTGTPDNFVITVTPMPTVNAIASQGLCVGSTTTAVTPTGNIPGTLYTWSNNNTSTGLGSGGTVLIAAFTGLNTNNAPNVSTVNVVPSYTYNNITCTGTAGQFGITINPTPSVDPVIDQQVCAQYNAAVQFTSTPNIVGTVYNWTNNNTAIGLAASGTGSLSFNATNLTSASITATITVTPSFTSAGSTCWGTAQSFEIVVLPTPVMNAVGSQTVCSGTATTALNFSSNLSGTQYAWTNSNTSIGLPASGTGNSIGTFNTTNSGTAPAQGLISIAPTLVTNNQVCTGSTVNTSITVNPIPVISTITNPSFCYGTAASIPLSSNINTGVVYNWTNSNTGIGLAVAGSGNISFTSQNTNSTAISGLLNVTPIYTNNAVQCNGTNTSFTIQVAPNPLVNAISNIDFCSGIQSTIIPINGTVTGASYSWTNANTAIGLQATGTGNIPVFTTSNSSSTSVASSLITVLPSLSFNGQTCNGPSSTFTIQINPGTTINTIPNVKLCNGETSIPINFSGSGSNYSWSSSTTNVGIAATGTSTISSFNAINTGVTPLNATVTVTSQFTGGSGTGCNGGSTAFNIEVLPTPSVVDPPNIIVCHGNTVNQVNLYGVATNYTWTNNTPSIGLTNSGTTATIPGFTATNIGTSPVVASVNTTPTYVSGNKTCTGTSQSYTITVIPTPTITTQPQSQTVCLGGSLNILSVGYVGGNGVPTYQWYSSSTNSSLNGIQIPGATSANYTLPAANSVGTTYYYCILSFPNSATCSTISSNLAAITITSGPSISTQPLASQSICVGGTISVPLSVAFANGTGSATCQWYSVSGGVNTLIPGATSVNYSPGIFSTIGSFSYMAQVILSGSGCGLAQSNTVQVNVLGDPAITSPMPASYCLNSSTAVPLSVTASGGISTAYNYQWYSNIVNNNSNGTAISGANAASYIPPTTAVATTYYYCEVNQGNGCSVSSNAAAIAVTSAPSISSQPLITQTVCLDGAVNTLAVTYSSGSGSPSFQWYSNSINSYVGGVAIPGASNASYVPVTSSIGTIYYYCVITFSQSGCSSISSNISQIIVVADPVVTNQPLNTQTICGGGSIPNALNVAYSGGTGTLSYQWYSLNGTTNTLIGGANSTTFLPSAFSTPGTFNFAVQITLSGSGCGMVQSNNAQVIVLPDPTVSAPVSASYCNGYSPVQALSVLPSGGLLGGFSYQWFSNTVNSNVGGTLITGATTANFTPAVTTNGTVYYYCAVSQGATNTGCSVSSATAFITTNPAPSISIQPMILQTACIGGTLNNLTVSYTGANTSPSYQWYSNLSNSNTGGTPILGANTTNYLPPNSTAGTNYYYCVISFPSLGCTTISSNPGAVTIHPDPIISIQPIASQAICFGTTLNSPLNISYTGGYGAASYQWNLVNGTITSPILTATNSSYLPSNYNIADTFYYNVTLSLSGNGCNAQTSNIAEVIVIPVPIIDSVGSYLYCNADTADMVVFSGPIPGTTYVWENDNVNIGLDSMGFGNIMPFEVTNLNNNGIVGNITATPQLTSLSTTCSGTPIEFMIIANPYQDVQDPADLILCHGQGLNGLQFVGTALINNWTNDQPALGIPASGSGTLPAFLAVNNGTQPIVANLSVTPTFNAVTTCPGDIETFTITILPSPNANVLPVNQLVCSGDLSTTINISGTATSFTWTNNQTSTGLAASGIGNIPAFLTTATGSNTTSTIAVTPVYSMNNVSCQGPVQNVQITVVPTPAVLPVQDIVLCSGEATGLIPILGNANQLNWTSSNPSIGTSALGIGSIPSFNVINNGQNPISSVITVTPINFFGGLTCMAPAENFSITVNPTPTISAVPDLVLCSQVNSPAIIFSGNANSYIWTNSNTAIGVSASGTGNISSFVTQNTLPSVISSVINVTPAFTNAGLTCPGTPESFVIDVLPQPSVNPINAQTICNSSATAPIIFTGNATSYTWINNNASIGIAVSGIGNIPSFNAVAGATTNVANIVVTPTYVYNNTVCSGTPLTTTITVLPSPSINTVQDFTACNGTLSGVLAFSGTASAFNWTNSNPSIGLSSNGNGNLPVFNYNNTSSNPLQATITVVPQTGQGNQVCLGSPEIFTITVNPTPSLLAPSNQVLCSQTQSLPVNFNGNASNYSWINSNTSIGLPSFGVGSIPAFVTQNNGTATSTAQIQVTPQFINAGATCLGTSQNFTISVDPIPSIQYSQIGQAICTGTSTNVINLSSPTSGVSFSWNILNPSSSISGISSMNGTGNIPSLSLVNSSNSSAQFNFQGIATTNLASCVGLGPIGTITVDPAPILQPLNDLTICSNNAVNDTLNASIPSTYSWSASSNPNISGQSIGLVNSNLIYNTLLNNSAVIQTITYTVTPTSFPLGCIGAPEDFVVEVVPNIQITSPLNFEICSGEPTNITLQSNFPGTFTFVANNNANVQGETISQQTGFYINDILSNSSSYDQVVSYNVQVSSNPYGCFGIPQVVNVEVHPEISITNASPTQMCSGAPLNLTLTATENATFSWYATQNSIVTGESLTPQTNPILTDLLVNTSNSWQEVMYTLSATSTVTGCAAQALPLSIIVNPIPIVGSLPDSVYCSGESTDALNWTLNGTANNYAWVNTNSSIGLPLSGNGNIAAFTVDNPGPQTVVSTITVTPQYINNGFICAGIPDQLTITVEPIPNISYSLQNQLFCSGDTSEIVVISSTTVGVNTTWQLLSVPNAITGDPTMPIIPSGINQIPGMILSNTSTTPQQILFQGTVSTPLNGCTTVGPIGQIVVQPEPVINNVNDSTICNNGVVAVNIDASVPSTYTWSAQSNPNVNGESVGLVNSNFIYNALQNTSSTIQYVYYTITPTSITGNCVGVDQDFTIEVIPDIVIDTLLTSLFDSICSGEQTGIYLQTNLPATITWHGINNPNVLGETTTPTNGFYISDVLINNTPFNQYVNYSIDMISSPYGCFGIPEVITMQVFPAIQLTNATNINLCSGDQLDLNLAATVNASFTWSATNNGVVQGESTTTQNTSILNDILINNSALSEQVFYSVDVVANNSSCQAFDLPVTVNVLPLPLLQNDDTTICSGQYTQINLVTNIPSNVIWNGVFNMDIQGETTANISGNYINDLLVNNSGQDDTLVYQIQAIANGCPAPLDSVLVIVHDQPDVDFVVSTTPLCTDNQVQFTNLSSPQFDYDWTFGDGGSSVIYSPTHIYANSGLYEVMLIATNPLNNCTAADSVNVIINKSPDASFYTMDTVGCGDLNATFFANYQATSDMVWDFGDGQTLAQVGNVTNYYGQAGCYDVTLTVTSPEGCVEQETYDDYVCVYENPIAFIGASPMSVNALEPTVQFSNSSQNAISYMWQMGDGNISYDDNPTYTYPMEGADYYVLMTAYNEVGCFDTASVSIHVYEELIFYVPNSFTPNDDEKNQTFYPVLSQGMKRNYLEFYVYNRWGELVFESHNPKYGWDGTYGQGAIDCPIGTYTWRLKLETLQTQEILEFRGHVNLIR